MADMGEEVSCMHKTNCDQRLEFASHTPPPTPPPQTNKQTKNPLPQTVQTLKLNLFKDRTV